MKKKLIMLVLSVVAIASLILVGCAPKAAPPAEKFTWTLSPMNPVSSFMTQGDIKFAETVAERTGGRLTIEVRCQIELGYKGTEQLRLVKDGVLNASDTPEGYCAPDDPAFGVTWLPFLARDFEEVRRGQKAIFPILSREFEEKWNGHLLFLNAFPMSTLHTAKKPIMSLDDLKGLKMRVPGGPFADGITAAGGVAVVIPAADTYTALARGTADGLVCSYMSLIDLGWYEPCPISTNIPFSVGAAGVIWCNLDDWNALPKDIQEIVTEESEKTNESMLTEATTANEELIKFLLDHGQQLVETPPAVSEEWAKLCEPVWESWADRGGPVAQELLEAYRAAVGR